MYSYLRLSHVIIFFEVIDAAARMSNVGGDFGLLEIVKDFRKSRDTSGSLEGLLEIIAHLRKSAAIVKSPGRPSTTVEDPRRILYVQDGIG